MPNIQQSLHSLGVLAMAILTFQFGTTYMYAYTELPKFLANEFHNSVKLKKL